RRRLRTLFRSAGLDAAFRAAAPAAGGQRRAARRLQPGRQRRRRSFLDVCARSSAGAKFRSMSRQKQADWAEARRRCRLNSEEVQMAKDLGFQPGKLIKNIPAPSQAWKAPVNEWVRSLYEKKFGSRPPGGTASPARSPSGPGVERRNREDPWPDNPLIPDLPCLVLDENVFPEDDEEPPSEDDILESEGQMLRRQRLFRWAAEAIAVAASELPEVEKVAAFGAVSQPLKPDVPRFRQFRRNRIPILHECADLDFAV